MYPFTDKDLPSCQDVKDFWQEIKQDSRPIIVYGTGNGADKLSEYLSLYGREISDFFASDGFCRGQMFRGKRVLSFAEVKEKYKDFVILLAFGSSRREVLDAVYSLSSSYDVRVPEFPLSEKELFDAAFYRAHYDDIMKAYALLEDDMSRSLFVSLILHRLTAKLLYLRNAVCYEDESSLLELEHIKTAVDVGAYRGDTLEKWRKEAPALTEVYAIEPDRKSFEKLSKNAPCMPFAVHLYHAAAWRADGEGVFFQSGNRNASLQKAEETASFQKKTDLVKTLKIDTILEGRSVELIKYDTEGAEKEAIEGTSRTIRACKPHLLVSAYHKSRDIFSLLLLLEEAYPGVYRYYFRRIECLPGWELNLLAIRK